MNSEYKPAVNQYSPVIISDDQIVVGDYTLSEIKNSKIPVFHKEILLARYGEKNIKSLDANYSGEKIKTLINITIFESGYKVENISELILCVIRDIFSDFSYMTLTDIALAFRKGVRGDLGDFMGLSVKTFYIWLKSYNDEFIIEANKQLLKIEKPKIEISDEEKAKLRVQWLQRHILDFEQFRESLVCKEYDLGNIFYEYCVKHSIAYLTYQDKIELKEQARKNLIQSYTSDKARNSNEIRDFKTIVNALINQDKSQEVKIVSEAKRLAIPVIYSQLIDKELELRELIKEIENWD